MQPFAVGGDVWSVLTVPAGDPRLVDRTGVPRLATTDPATMTVCVSEAVPPPLFDRVVLHEVAHAVAWSRGLVAELRAHVPPGWWVFVEEWAARMAEGHAVEMAELASRALGRPVCVGGYCHAEP